MTPPMILGAHENGVATWEFSWTLWVALVGWFHGCLPSAVRPLEGACRGEAEAFAVALVLYGLRGGMRGRCILSS